jgi:hypothetical protein
MDQLRAIAEYEELELFALVLTLVLGFFILLWWIVEIFRGDD